MFKNFIIRRIINPPTIEKIKKCPARLSNLLLARERQYSSEVKWYRCKMEFIRDPPFAFCKGTRRRKRKLRLIVYFCQRDSRVPCINTARKSQTFWHPAIKRSLVLSRDRKKPPQPGREIPLVLIFRTIIRPVYIDERALGRMVGCFQEINHIRKGFSHFTRIYLCVCVRARVCVSVSLCACIRIYIYVYIYIFVCVCVYIYTYIHTFFFRSGFFSLLFCFFLLLIQTADARKFRTESRNG